MPGINRGKIRMVYNKTLSTIDYQDLRNEEAHLNHMKYILSNTPYSFEHKHRMWEYALTLKALKDNKTKSLLDVGGGASIFAPACAFLGIGVTQVDLEDREKWVDKQNEILNTSIWYIRDNFLSFNFVGKFDAVTAISVLEHIELDEVFFRKLLKFVNPGGLVAITVDFHPDSRPFVKEHLRTYNEKKINRLISMAMNEGFVIYGGHTDYRWRGPDVNGYYTFASLIMKKFYEPDTTSD